MELELGAKVGVPAFIIWQMGPGRKSEGEIGEKAASSPFWQDSKLCCPSFPMIDAPCDSPFAACHRHLPPGFPSSQLLVFPPASLHRNTSSWFCLLFLIYLTIICFGVWPELLPVTMGITWKTNKVVWGSVLGPTSPSFLQHFPNLLCTTALTCEMSSN